ncbi:TRAP transporter small permease [Ureibacillus manganicus]|uniref:Tripartite ATP-independent periplasmic transporters DctQ component domain-containing protein n=1 Tax=Ureibacillus manganicus DSM 26584 TaxID=1384049 RepID=A0A0A3I4M2_9BACL|nr:TRAP transporter small permease [Ureibacillus manganicus]KGR77623.1 hypothetical protein CD29_14315 [Ureibacillus manganicus DSM 26584]
MKHLAKIADTLSVILFALLVADVFLQVLARLFKISNVTWTEELSRFLFVWLIFIGAFTMIRRGMNIRFDLVEDVLPTKVWKITFTIGNICSLLFLVVIAFYGSQLAIMNMTQLSPVMQIPMGLVYAALPVGAILMIAAQIELYFKLMKNRGENLAHSSSD